MSATLTPEIKHQLIELFMKSQRINSPMYQLLLIREKLEARPLQPDDREDILSELGNLQSTLRQINSGLQHLHTLLK